MDDIELTSMDELRNIRTDMSKILERVDAILDSTIPDVHIWTKEEAMIAARKAESTICARASNWINLNVVKWDLSRRDYIPVKDVYDAYLADVPSEYACNPVWFGRALAAFGAVTTTKRLSGKNTRFYTNIKLTGRTPCHK